ncbi:MAG TPA: hypothetical protein VKQ08_09890 [Cyclobacteriaceae bacterium]|nr:hypothetical protein [Cyclobacteriaceae bacterium]
MKLKFSIAVLLVGCFAGFVTQAQDESQPAQEVQEFNQQHPDLNLGEDKTLLMDTDIKAPKSTSTTREANALVNNPKSKPDNSARPSSSEKTDEDPLSNFLYFIIQKFKISDIVDD